VPALRQGAAAVVREEREQSQNGDREQNRVDDRATGDRDDQQDPGSDSARWSAWIEDWY
jgi:hypothetical protein